MDSFNGILATMWHINPPQATFSILNAIHTRLCFVLRYFVRLAHWGRDKMAAILLLADIFKCIFEWTYLDFDWNVAEVCFWVSNSQYSSVLQMTALRWPGDKMLSESMIVWLPVFGIQYYKVFGLNNLNEHWYIRGIHGPLTRYVNLRVAHAPGIPGTFSPPSTSKETAI